MTGSAQYLVDDSVSVDQWAVSSSTDQQILLDKHQDVLSTCTVKVGHRNPFITASEMLENEQKTAAFTATLRSKSDVANKVAGTSSSEVQAGVDESNKAKDLKNKEVAKVDEAEVTASGSGIKVSTSPFSIEPLSAPLHHSHICIS